MQRPRATRFKKPPVRLHVTTLWDYPSQHYGDKEQGSQNFEGATPSHVIWNVVSRYTREGQVVLDPFAGSGTTIDVCNDLKREAIAFDVAPQRPEIKESDARSIPLKSASVDLVFMDPPYADNLAYSDDSRCLGKLPPDGRWQRAMRLCLEQAFRVLREDGVLAVYLCDILRKKIRFHALGFETFGMAMELGFHAIDIAAVVRRNRTLEMGNYRKAADQGGFMLRGFNYLLLFRKPRRETDARVRDKSSS